MKRSAVIATLVIALLLSVGFNLGLLVAAGLFDGGKDAVPEEEVADDVAHPESLRDAPPPPDSGPGEAPPGPPPRFLAMVERLELDPDQRRQFERLHGAFFEDLARGRRQLGALRAELVTELQADEPDPERLRELVRRMSAINARLDSALVRTTLETRRLLDADQEEAYVRHFVGQILRGPSGQGGPPRRPRFRQSRDRAPAERPPGP